MQLNEREEQMERVEAEQRSRAAWLAARETHLDKQEADLRDREAEVAEAWEDVRVAQQLAAESEEKAQRLKDSLKDAVSAEAFARSMSQLFSDFAVAGMAKLVAHERVDAAAKVATGAWSTLAAAGGGHVKEAAEVAAGAPHPQVEELSDSGERLHQAVQSAVAEADRNLVDTEIAERGEVEAFIMNLDEPPP
jgi:DNA repair exonuclease SbcCD ATPase subunit